MSIRPLLYLTAIFLAVPSWAATPIIYSRGEVNIVPTQVSQADAQPVEDKTKASGKEIPAREPHRFNVEIRPEKAFIRNAGMFTQPVLDEKTGIMAIVEEPGIVPIVGDNIYTPFDILFVNPQGKISQIAPSVNLSELNGEIFPMESVRAFIYLQAGACKKFDIRPGDTVSHEAFDKNPVIITK